MPKCLPVGNLLYMIRIGHKLSLQTVDAAKQPRASVHITATSLRDMILSGDFLHIVARSENGQL